MAHERDVKDRRDSLVFVIFSKLDQPGTRIPKNLARLLEKRIYMIQIQMGRSSSGEGWLILSRKKPIMTLSTAFLTQSANKCIYIYIAAWTRC